MYKMYKMLFLANQKKPISKSCRAGPNQVANFLGNKILTKYTKL
jgi:hypothetical protein